MMPLRTRAAPKTGSHGRRRDVAADQPFPTLGLATLGAAIFVSMSSEFLPGGLLGGIADTFHRSVTDAGQLTSVFAAAVIILTAPLAFLTRRLPRKVVLLAAIIGIAVATAATAAAPTFEVLLAARVFGGAAHGLFWAVAAAYAAGLVASSQLSRATAITAAGGSLAGVLGVPLGNALGQFFGWRIAFAAVAVVALLTVPLLQTLLPPLSPTAAKQPNTDKSGRHEASRALRVTAGVGGIVIVCATILTVVIGQTTFGTYSVVWLTEVAALPAPTVPFYLLATGVSSLIAISAMGALADRRPGTTLVVGVVVMVVLMLLFPVMSAWGVVPLVAVAVLQSMAFAVVPALLQVRMMRVTAPEQRSLAAAMQTTAFNIAIGGGAVLGAQVIGIWSLQALPWAAAALSAIGLLFLLIFPERNVPRGALSLRQDPLSHQQKEVMP